MTPFEFIPVVRVRFHNGSRAANPFVIAEPAGDKRL